ALRMSGIEPAHPAIPNAAALNDGLLRATQRAARAAETGNAAASAEEASGADAPTDAPSETADENARLDAREAELLAEAEGHPPAEVEAVPQPAAASGAAPSAPPAKAPPPHLRGTTAGEEAQEGRGARAPCDEAGDGPVSGPLVAGGATVATVVALLDAYHMVPRPRGAVAIATLILAATAAALVGVRWATLLQPLFNPPTPRSLLLPLMPGGDLVRDERRESAAYVRSLVDQAQEQAADGRVTPLAILDAAPPARGGDANVALHPVMLTAFTYDDPELTSAATAA
ncbi:unnamed protein product, partial [Symbiodinium necroappetens]